MKKTAIFFLFIFSALTVQAQSARVNDSLYVYIRNGQDSIYVDKFHEVDVLKGVRKNEERKHKKIRMIVAKVFFVIVTPLYFLIHNDPN